MTEPVARRYLRVAGLFCRWCAALNLPQECDYAQLSSWAWYYCLRFSVRSLGNHWSALRWWCDTTGREYPEEGTNCYRKMRRVMQALRLSDPTTETRCYALCNHRLVSMQRRAGLADEQSMRSCRLSVLVFWARLRTAHFCMCRRCEHEHGFFVEDLSRHEVRGGGVLQRVSSEFFVLRVGVLPEGLQPRYASRRKLKLRPAREPVIPIWDDPSSPGLLMRVMLERLEEVSPGYTSTPGNVLFPEVEDGPMPRLLPTALHPSTFLRRMRGDARRSGLREQEVLQIEFRSLRAGGCTDFFANGVPREDIMRQGGWTSETVDIYNRPTEFLRWVSFSRVIPRQ